MREGDAGEAQLCRTFAHGREMPSIVPLCAAMMSHPCRTYDAALPHFGTRLGEWAGLCATMSQLRPQPETNYWGSDGGWLETGGIDADSVRQMA